MTDGGRLLTARQLADWLGVSPGSAWRLARERRVPGLVVIGRSYRFDREAIEAWIAGGGTARPHRQPPDSAV